MTNELDNIFASLPTDPARKRKRSATEAASKGADRAPPPKRAGAASAPAQAASGEARGTGRSTARPSHASTSDLSSTKARATAPKGACATNAKDARATESKGDAPGRRVPVVVHDTSAPARPTASGQPARPADDEDAAFADSRGRDRKRTEEGFRIFTEDELRLNEGGGTPLCPFDCDCCF
ncbi:hypothetical protein MCAP1_000331 [Malassezia caprae]|uniref:DUF1764-domain-containing protein n=1 Tax=Malassezia caprae TaxID=1381934 RepID=A0AAF0E4Q0_9BASI|nr:hypothetical protein MCAP1_000331 [Malassezia caprae]